MKNTRGKLKAAAIDLFMERGFNKTSIAAIEEKAGLVPRAGGFYRHYDSKQALLLEISREHILETPEKLGFTKLLPLGDTRAELYLLAKGYRQTNELQKPFLKVIDEYDEFEEVKKLITKVEKEILAAAVDWISTKPAARGKNRQEIIALLLAMMGGWLFYMGKNQTGFEPEGLTLDKMLDHWVEFWASVLDRV